MAHIMSDSYSLEDFEHVDKIDMHVHINALDTTFVDQALADNFRALTVNVEYSDFPPLEEQLRIARSLKLRYPNRVAYSTTFTMKGWGEPDWTARTLEHLERTLADGACAVKVWKNIGMEFRDREGKIVMIDDPGFDAIFAWIRERKFPLIGHLGEPRDCWLPLDQIAIKYIKDYFATHPHYHMYLQPEMPSYEAQLRARDGMLEKNPGIRFVGAHLSSLEWSVSELAKFLDRFPFAVVDLAARVGDLQYQTARNRDEVRNFFMKYQDRILYATDMMWHGVGDAEAFKKELHEQWLRDWKYLCTDLSFHPPDIVEPVMGLDLPRAAIDKIYRTNAERTFGKFPSS
jgi:hypothetical protein